MTESRYNIRLKQLSGERWKASAALGYVKEKKIFYTPYETSDFYYQMLQRGLLKVLRNLTEDEAMVLLATGSDVASESYVLSLRP